MSTKLLAQQRDTPVLMKLIIIKEIYSKNPRTLAHVFTLNRETQKHPHSSESLIKVKHLDLLQDADQSGDA